MARTPVPRRCKEKQLVGGQQYVYIMTCQIIDAQRTLTDAYGFDYIKLEAGEFNFPRTITQKEVALYAGHR